LTELIERGTFTSTLLHKKEGGSIIEESIDRDGGFVEDVLIEDGGRPSRIFLE
jgi:hypothetical protein